MMKEVRAADALWWVGGSSLIWDLRLVAPLLERRPAMSLQEFVHRGINRRFGDLDGLVVVAGLQTALDLLPGRQGLDYVRDVVQQAVYVSLNALPAVPHVFVLHCTHRDWYINRLGHPALVSSGCPDVALTMALWNGIAEDAQPLMVEVEGQVVCGGYHVKGIA